MNLLSSRFACGGPSRLILRLPQLVAAVCAVLLGAALLAALPARATLPGEFSSFDPSAADAPAPHATSVLVLSANLDAAISPAQVDLLQDLLATAAAEHATFVVLRLNTPGGLADSMREMVTQILNAPVPVAVWVGPSGARAASAGVFLVAAADVAAMAPQSTIGAASPVSMGGGEMDETMTAKVTNDILSLVRGVAAARKRNVEWYERAVTEAVSIPASEAVAERVVDLMAVSVPDLVIQVGRRGLPTPSGRQYFTGEGARIVEYDPGTRYKLLEWLLNPSVAYLLLLGGLAGLFFELISPGAILPGVVGTFCLLLGLYALSVLPFSVAGLLLILLGVVLFILEIHVTSFGLLSVAAVASLFIGSMILFRNQPGMTSLPMTTVLVTVATVSLLIGLGVYLAAKAQLSRPAQGDEALLGQVGTVRAWSGERGQVFVRGELWAAAMVPEAVAPSLGSRVEVVAVRGLMLEVRPAPGALPGPGGAGSAQ